MVFVHLLPELATAQSEPYRVGGKTGALWGGQAGMGKSAGGGHCQGGNSPRRIGKGTYQVMENQR